MIPTPFKTLMIATVKKICIVIAFFFTMSNLYPQQNNIQLDLLEKANENYTLLSKDPTKALNTAIEIEKKAKINQAEEAELKALHTICSYYKTVNDFENMMVASKSLDNKASLYKNSLYQLIAKRFIFESYLFTGLHDKALNELELGKGLIKTINSNDSLSIIESSNFHIAYSNYFLLKEDYRNQLKYIKLAQNELQKLPEGKNTQKLFYIHYSNLATSFNNNNIKDSAAYYAKLSQSKGRLFTREEVVFNNLSVLGDVELHKSNYTKALSYLKQAEKIKLHKNYLDVEELYNNIILAYTKLENHELANSYKIKKDSLRLFISENQNKSLHRLLIEKDEPKTNKLKVTFIIALLTMLVILFFVLRKNRILTTQEKLSQQYLEKTEENPSGKDYSNLLKILKENDPAFMFYFEDTFPDFSSKLLQINPDISSSEIEFCALLKLKITTKDIAKYKFVAPKTVRNRKYHIRKKLHIPKDVDIYQWFCDL